ncbi:MAG: phosphatase [Lachnospiraceae bacterium]|nr:phosphatase [Lachnospiraceae bacterium]
MKYVMDLHTHTIACGHAYSTLQENIARAQEIGLQVLGLSEHGPATKGGPDIMFFWNLKIVPRQYGKLRLLCGIEANIMDREGGLDVDAFTLSRLDYCIASMHTFSLECGDVQENTRAAINAMKNPYVTILGHPDDSRYPLNYDELVQAAVKERVVLEVNNSSLHPLSARQGARENILALLEACKKYECPIILGTDSHISFDIGLFEQAQELLEEVDFPEELIMNTSVEKLEKMLSWKRK